VARRIDAILRLSGAGLDEDLERVVRIIRESFRARVNETTTQWIFHTIVQERVIHRVPNRVHIDILRSHTKTAT